MYEQLLRGLDEQKKRNKPPAKKTAWCVDEQLDKQPA